ncbi:SusC/RagA family TonB-linked outer membrane protein [Chitinophaga sp. GCM10012297]|uniref:TonB-dependent receptor n=1 Tax=Chitinophaga chungangae TaxID=2821488 RepID=A0ABS3YGI4_9BACT|nr:TonB-dependent receptor [Chitinophaga chungangae]MBO9153565.1 TonB-dependent receptor [Chitinophaga chungangae]
MKRHLLMRICCVLALLLPLLQQSKAAPPPAAIAFNKEIKGQVTDSSGSAVPGVTILVKGSTTIGTTTDMNGRFILDVPDNTLVLVFSMIGYTTQEVPLNGRTTLHVNLAPANNQLGETVIVAYGKQKRESVIGSITSINPGELKVPSSNLTTALAGRMAGIIAYQRSGEPGRDNAEFYIRGATTFGYKKDPLILIDNIEYTTTELARLQPDDIASFSIMKDATANALYGARGANGVILVTTKEGRAGKAKINIRLENSFSSPTRDIELTDPVTYMKLHNEAVATRNPLAPLPYTQAKIDYTEAGINPTVYPTTDWREMLFKKSTTTQRANFNVSGGGDIATYYISGGVNKDNGILKVDGRNNFNNNIDLKTYNLRSNINLRVTKSTQVMVRLNGTFDDYNGPIDGGQKLFWKMLHTSQVRFPAYYPKDDDHAWINHIMFGNEDQGQYLNPYADMVKGYREYSRSLMVAQFELKQDLSDIITKGLSLRGMMNTNRTAYFELQRQYNPFWYTVGAYDKPSNEYQIYNINPETGTDYLSFVPRDKTVQSVFYGEVAMDYNRTFDNKHNLAGMLIFIARNRLEGNNADGLQKSLPARNLGLSGRATYGYDNRYFFEFNFGYNGSERFYKTERFGFFPTAGAAWYISNEKWWDPYKSFIHKLKIRANYGLVGNDQIGDENERFFYLSNVNMNDGGKGARFGNTGGYSRPGISIQRYDNPAITWETAKNSTFGLEIGLLKNIDIILEYFTEHRTSILMSRASIPKTMGLQGTTPKANVGSASSKSYEATLDYNAKVNKDWFVSARGTFTFSRNLYENYEEPMYEEPYRYRKGHSTAQRWGYIAERLFIDDEEVRSSPTQSFNGFITRAGDIKFRDINGDKIIDQRDMVPIGFPDRPEISYGIWFSTTYKNFDFSLYWQGSARSSFWINVEETSPFLDYRQDGSDVAVSETQMLKVYSENYWSEENRNLYALWPRLSPELNSNSAQQSTWFMRNGSFLRLKQVEVGYSLPRHLTKRWHIESVRIYGSGTNLFTISGFKLWDVEMAGNGLGYPVQKVMNIGLNIGF